MIHISPSVLGADLMRLGEEIELVERLGLTWLHIDNMDGHFVPNISFGPDAVAAIRRKTKLFLDVHLMLSHPKKYIRTFAEAGADIIVNSIHKTLASLTESALLNVNSDRVDLQLLEDRLQAIESTSPSYILMASLDINASIIAERGEELFSRWAEALDWFYAKADSIRGLRTINNLPGLDRTKINISFGDLGISGAELEQMLMNEFGIFIELFTGDLLMCMTGIGSTEGDIRRLAEALEKISEAGGRKKSERSNNKRSRAYQPAAKAELSDVPVKKRKVKLTEAEGLVCASSIIPYPPGIPFICPGERITAEAIAQIKEMRDLGEKVIGINEKGEILVGDN